MQSMTEAYFVGRNELLHWINTTADFNFQKVEQTANGAVACQLLDSIQPGVVQMQKVDFSAKNEYDQINNYKQLQNAFNKLGIEKEIPVQQLIKGKPLDNTEFMQWMKFYIEQQTGGIANPEYNPQARRQGAKGVGKGGQKIPLQGKRQSIASEDTAAKRPGSRTLQRPLKTPTPTANNSNSNNSNAQSHHRSQSQAGIYRQENDAIENQSILNNNIINSSDTNGVNRINGIKKPANQDKTSQNKDLQLKVQQLEQKLNEVAIEKDFYFSKLRDIEILCQTSKIKSEYKIMDYVEQILYSNDYEAQKQALDEVTKVYGVPDNE